MRADKLRRYLGATAERLQARTVTLARRVYFAGTSRRWQGAVAFLSLTEHPETAAHARAYLLSEDDFAVLFAGENGTGELRRPLEGLGLTAGNWAEIALPWGNPTLGKYNAVVRLADLEGVPAYTLTTCRLLDLGPPAPDYLDVIVDGLVEHIGADAAHRYGAALIAHEPGDNQRYISAEPTPEPG